MNPQAIQFRKLIVSKVTMKDGTFVPYWCGEVNSKNSYGAYLGFKRFNVYMKKDEKSGSLNKTTILMEPTILKGYDTDIADYPID